MKIRIRRIRAGCKFCSYWWIMYVHWNDWHYYFNFD